MAQPVECPALDFSSGHDLRVEESSPTLGSALSMEPAWDSLPTLLCPSTPLVHSLSNKFGRIVFLV